MQRPVHQVLNSRRHKDLPCLRVHRDEGGVEERVEISAQQEAIGDMVGLGAEIRRDVRGLEDMENIAASYGATALIGLDQCIAELLLTSAGADLAEYLISGVLMVRRVERLLLGCLRVQECGALDAGRLVWVHHDIEAEPSRCGTPELLCALYWITVANSDFSTIRKSPNSLTSLQSVHVQK